MRLSNGYELDQRIVALCVVAQLFSGCHGRPSHVDTEDAGVRDLGPFPERCANYLWCRDRDGDGEGNPAETARAHDFLTEGDCVDPPAPTGWTRDWDCDDCDDTDPMVMTLVVADLDGDGADNWDDTLCVGVAPPGYRVRPMGYQEGDCDDTDPTVTTVYTRDADGDGYGDTDSADVVCGPPVEREARPSDPPGTLQAPNFLREYDGRLINSLPGYGPASDCDDANPLIHPDAGEFFGDQADADCNGQPDPGCHRISNGLISPLARTAGCDTSPDLVITEVFRCHSCWSDYIVTVANLGGAAFDGAVTLFDEGANDTSAWYQLQNYPSGWWPEAPLPEGALMVRNVTLAPGQMVNLFVFYAETHDVAAFVAHLRVAASSGDDCAPENDTVEVPIPAYDWLRWTCYAND